MYTLISKPRKICAAVSLTELKSAVAQYTSKLWLLIERPVSPIVESRSGDSCDQQGICYILPRISDHGDNHFRLNLLHLRIQSPTASLQCPNNAEFLHLASNKYVQPLDNSLDTLNFLRGEPVV